MSNLGDKLFLFIAGPGYGEGIVVHLPGGHWGVIDCCKEKVKRKGSKKEEDINPVLMFLKKNNVRKLDFVILTHPHFDHTKGLADIIGEPSIGIGSVYQYFAISQIEILAEQNRAIDRLKRAKLAGGKGQSFRRMVFELLPFHPFFFYRKHLPFHPFFFYRKH